LGTAAAGSLTLSAQSNGTGNGGTIEVGYISTLTVGGTLSAAAGSSSGGNGNGGTINLHDNGGLTVTGTIEANGYGSGTGGTVTLDSNATTLSSATITANGGPNNGNGGTFNISNQTAEIDQDTVIDVDAGDDQTGCCTAAVVRPLAQTSIDGVKNYTNKSTGFVAHCQQWSTGTATWPLSWWDCTPNLAQPNDLDKVPVNLAASKTFASVQVLLNTYFTAIYVVADNNNYNAVFNPPTALPAIAGGLTIRVGTHTYSSPWQSGSIGDPNPKGVINYSEAQYTEVSAHELGHAVDIANGTPSSTNSDYGTFISRDSFDMNNVVDVSSPSGYTTRLPCAQTIYHNGTTDTIDTPPFQGVLDMVDGPAGGPYPNVCTVNGTLNATLAGKGFNGNINILAWLEPLWGQATEINAQTFAYIAVGNQGARPMNDLVLENGGIKTIKTAIPRYLGCVEAWAQSQLAGQPAGPGAASTPSGSCFVAP